LGAVGVGTIGFMILVFVGFIGLCFGRFLLPIVGGVLGLGLDDQMGMNEMRP
jgi:hypothetical protein